MARHQPADGGLTSPKVPGHSTSACDSSRHRLVRKPGAGSAKLAGPTHRHERLRGKSKTLAAFNHQLLKGIRHFRFLPDCDDAGNKFISPQNLRVVAMWSQHSGAPIQRFLITHEIAITCFCGVRSHCNQPQRKFGRDPCLLAPAQVRAMARPAIVRSIGNESGAHWIEMNVAHHRKEVVVCVDQHCVVTALEQMTSGVDAFLNRASVATGNAKNDAAQRNVRYLHQQMNVIGHPAVGMHPAAQLGNGLRDNIIQQIPVSFSEEDWLSMIASQGHMVEATRDVKSELTGHHNSRYLHDREVSLEGRVLGHRREMARK
jgi:hypothetical protein